jgi:hypothetical protein
MPSVFRTIKEEESQQDEYRYLDDAQTRIRHFISDVYQTKHIYSALSYLTPVEFEVV